VKPAPAIPVDDWAKGRSARRTVAPFVLIGGPGMLIERLRQSGYVLQPARGRRNPFRLVWRRARQVCAYVVDAL